MYNESKMMRSPPVAVPLVLHIRAERLDLGDLGGEGFDSLVGIFLAIHQVLTDAPLVIKILRSLGGEGL